MALSTSDLPSIKNALLSLFTLQTPDGLLPYAGIGYTHLESFTYHLYTLCGVYNYYLWTGELIVPWEMWKKGMEWSLRSVMGDEGGT